MSPFVRNDGPYTISNQGTTFAASESIGDVCIFEDSNGKIHLVAALNGNQQPFDMVDFNLTDDTYHCFHAPSPNSEPCGPSCFVLMDDVLYIGARYYIFKYDLAGNISLIYDADSSGSLNTMNQGCIGDDGNVYFLGQSGGNTIPVKAYKVDTSDDSVTILGNIAITSTHGAYGGYSLADGGYLYIAVRDTTDTEYYLTVIRLSDNNVTHYYNGNGDTSGEVKPCNGGGLQYVRTLADTSKLAYDLSSGAPGGSPTSECSRPDTNYIDQWSLYPIQKGSRTGVFTGLNYNLIFDFFPAWEHDMTSQIGYRTPAGSGSYTYKTIDWPFNVAYDFYVYRVQPIADDKILVFPDIYGPTSVWDYTAQAVSEWLGYYYESNYSSVKLPSGLIALGNYSAGLQIYDPALPWTLDSSNYKSTGYDPDDPTRPNAYDAKLDTGNWCYFTTYDADGVVWQAANDRNYPGTLGYWNPADKADYGIYRSELESIPPQSLGVALGRTKILYGGNQNQLFVMDAATRTLDFSGSPITLISPGFTGHVHVADVTDGDQVLVIVTDGVTGYKLLLVDITAGTTVWTKDCPALPFGYSGPSAVFSRGPDGYYYLFCGTHFYALNLAGDFTDLGDFTTYYRFAFNGPDTILNRENSQNVYVIFDMFSLHYNSSSPLGIEGGQPGGMPGGHVDGI